MQLRDLGFFNLRVLAAEDQAGIYWITRVEQGTRIYQRDGRVIDNLAVWLQQHACPAGRVDISILLGAKQRLACRLVATRVPDEVLEARVQKAVLEARKRQRVADHFLRENLAWNIRVTNLASDQISADDVFTVYRLRWQRE